MQICDIKYTYYLTESAYQVGYLVIYRKRMKKTLITNVVY